MMPPDPRHLRVISLMDRPTLGDYRIEGIVGLGRTGIVYLATDSRTGRAVALKVLREDVSIDPIYRERFRREGALLAAIRHPHVIPIYGMGELNGDLYIATRLASGTLKSLILAGPIDLDLAVRIVTAVGEAVDAAHSAGVVHRDVKPANVLLDPGPQIFLGDFGNGPGARDSHAIRCRIGLNRLPAGSNASSLSMRKASISSSRVSGRWRAAWAWSGCRVRLLP